MINRRLAAIFIPTVILLMLVVRYISKYYMRQYYICLAIVCSKNLYILHLLNKSVVERAL